MKAVAAEEKAQLACGPGFNVPAETVPTACVDERQRISGIAADIRVRTAEGQAMKLTMIKSDRGIAQLREDIRGHEFAGKDRLIMSFVLDLALHEAA
jgi:hypothetical protein